MMIRTTAPTASATAPERFGTSWPTDQVDNRIVLEGRVCSGPDTRCSPAGIPITRFGLEHVSQQLEAGHPRQARCRISVVAAGNELQPALETLVIEKQVRVTGFLSSASYQSGEFRLVLHAQQIEQLPDAAH